MVLFVTGDFASWPMTLNIISDLQQSWLFTLLPSVGWRREEGLLGHKQDMAKWPKATSLSFSKDLLCPMSWPSLLCPGVTLSKRDITAEVRSTGELCPTTCTVKQCTKPLHKGGPTRPQEQHPTRTMEDLGILELLSLSSFGSKGDEVPS